MKKIVFVAIALFITVTGVFAQTKVDRKGSKNAESGSKNELLVYTCPMHPNEKLDKQVKCQICGMTLVEKKKSTAPKKDSTSMKGMKM